ncbi:MAG: hypothetical protein K2J20_02550, partial [Bacilli bacterium]|nr:hypothetical protein [Bacilli bacterium]
PNASYRIFYENIKTLKVNIYSEADYNKRFPSGSDANYNSRVNALNLKKNASKDIICHELAHTYHSFYRASSNLIIIKSEKHTALNEGMTDLMTDNVASTNDRISSYKISKNVVKFLMYITDSTYEDYSRYGLDYLISEAEKLYPDINFKYISNTLNTMASAEIYRVRVKASPIDLYNELFEVCLKHATKTNGYEPFNKFLYILSETKDSSLVNDYFQKYNEKLKALGYNPQIMKNVGQNSKIYEKANCVIYDPANESSLAFGYEDENYTLYKINADGSSSKVNTEEAMPYCSFLPKNFDLFKLKALTNNKNLKEGVTNTLIGERTVSPHYFSAIPIYNNGKLLTTTMTGSLSIQVGFTKNGKIGFIIYSKDGKVVYKTNENLTNLSNKISLNEYLSSYYYSIGELELTDILSESYIKEYQSKYIGFYNFSVVEDKIVMEPSTIITIIRHIDGKEYRQNYKVSECKLYVYDTFILASGLGYEPAGYDYAISLEEVLKFNDFLVDGVPCYTINMTELTNMTEKYITSLNKELNVPKGRG